jgi:hypothetical protein
MVCTGDILIFGIQMKTTYAIEYLLKYLKNKIPKNKYNDLKETFEDNNNREAVENLKKNISQLNLSIEIIRPSCCLFSDDDKDDYGLIYLGKELCSNDLVSRFDVKEFKTIEDYENFYMEGLLFAKELLKENKEKYIEDIAKIIPNGIPKFYNLPNDCFSCT